MYQTHFSENPKALQMNFDYSPCQIVYILVITEHSEFCFVCFLNTSIKNHYVKIRSQASGKFIKGFVLVILRPLK